MGKPRDRVGEALRQAKEEVGRELLEAHKRGPRAFLRLLRKWEGNGMANGVPSVKRRRR